MSFQTETLCLKGNGATAGEWIENHWQFAIGRIDDLCVRRGEQFLVVEVFQTTRRSISLCKRSRSFR